MMTEETIATENPSDSELVARSLAGDRDAFGRIVSRYQTLICSLAYSGIGNLGQSEDIAEETFVTAWKRLRQLREPAKLRSWLCGIVRNRIQKIARREGNQPTHDADSVDVLQDLPAIEMLPSEQTVHREEEAILWRALERIPELYREPVVLFYRGHHSVEAVAAQLELSEDAVKQRLSRGRKLLHEEVLAVVEGTLSRTNPGKAFTVAVLATVPFLSTSAKAATIGAAGMKSGTLAKGVVLSGVLNVFIAPVLGTVGPWSQYRAILAAAKTEPERRVFQRRYHRLFGAMFGAGLLLVSVIIFGTRFVGMHPLAFASALITLLVSFVVASVRLATWTNRLFGSTRVETSVPGERRTTPGWEFRSKWTLSGRPLVHFRFRQSDEHRPPVRAWIAAGDTALGMIFAFGGVAVAPISIGGIAIGLLPCGIAAIGVFALGGFAIGGWAFGGFAVGWQCFGGCALALNAARGGLAIARDFALGSIAHATHANSAIASQFMKGGPFFPRMETLSRHVGWLNLLWLIPITNWWRLFAKRRSNLGDLAAASSSR